MAQALLTEAMFLKELLFIKREFFFSHKKQS
jgi:hypothetical protein